MNNSRLEAYLHECGHAIAALYSGLRVIEVVVNSDGSGHCRQDTTLTPTPSEAILIALAGGSAAALLGGSMTRSPLGGTDGWPSRLCRYMGFSSTHDGGRRQEPTLIHSCQCMSMKLSTWLRSWGGGSAWR